MGFTSSTYIALLFLSSISLEAQDPVFKNIEHAGGSGSDSGFDISVDNNGNVIVGGRFTGNANFNGTSVQAVGSANDAFIASYDPSGNLTWVKNFGGVSTGGSNAGSNNMNCVTTDNFEDVIFTGSYIGSTTVDGITLPLGGNNEEAFLGKLDNSGTLLWIKAITGSYTVQGFGSVSDALNNVYVTGFFGHGNFGGNVTFDGNTFTTFGGGDIFLAKYSPSGTLLWARQDGSSTVGDSDVGRSLVIDPIGNIGLVGRFVGTASFGSMTVASNGGLDICLAKYDSNGEPIWVKGAGGSGQDVGQGIGVDSDGNFSITGWFSGSANFGSTVLTSAGARDVFAARYDSDGNELWAISMGGSEEDFAYDLTCDADGNSFITGGFRGSCDFGGTILTSVGSDDIFVAKVNPQGGLEWVVQAGGPNLGGSEFDRGLGIGIKSDGNAVVTGGFFGQATFSDNSVSSYGHQDIFWSELGTPCYPDIICPFSDQTVIALDQDCQVSLPDYRAQVTFDQSCNPKTTPIIRQDPAPGTLISAPGEIQEITLSADWGNDNITSCAFNLLVEDHEYPTIVCPDGSITPFTLASDANCDAVLPDYSNEATVTDNCTESAAIIISQSPPPGTILNGHGTSQLVTLTADDGNGNTATCSFTVTVQDQTDPLIVCPSNISVTSDPGTCTAVVNFADPLVTDNCAIDYVVCVPSSGSTFPLGTTTVTCTASDINGNSSQCTFDVIVEDIEGPTIAEIKVPIDPIPLGSPISTVAYFENCNDISEAYWDWGDDSTSPGNIFDDSISGSHIFDSVGVFRVSVTIIDSYGNVASETAIAYIVIYDPSAGFVTGSGWIESPPGAYLIDETITGKAHFGFVSRYQSGATIPTGRTDFRFKAADLLFEGVAFEWLVVAGANTKFKGTGTINGTGNYGFMLTATDGSINGGGGSDKFRIKIWDIDASETVVYDNKLGSDDVGYDAQEIGAGAIKIHKTNGNNNRMQFTTPLISSKVKLSAYPNPFQQDLEINFTLDNGSFVNLVVYDIYGRHIKTLVNEVRSAGLYSKLWHGNDDVGTLVSSGVYLIKLETEAGERITPVVFQH